MRSQQPSPLFDSLSSQVDAGHLFVRSFVRSFVYLFVCSAHFWPPKLDWAHRKWAHNESAARTNERAREVK